MSRLAPWPRRNSFESADGDRHLGALGKSRPGAARRSLTDRRSVVAVATDRGRELAEKAPPLLRDRFRHELAKLTSEQQMQLL